MKYNCTGILDATVHTQNAQYEINKKSHGYVTKHHMVTLQNITWVRYETSHGHVTKY